MKNGVQETCASGEFLATKGSSKSFQPALSIFCWSLHSNCCLHILIRTRFSDIVANPLLPTWLLKIRQRITMITGFETFNARLYKAAARRWLSDAFGDQRGESEETYGIWSPKKCRSSSQRDEKWRKNNENQLFFWIQFTKGWFKERQAVVPGLSICVFTDKERGLRDDPQGMIPTKNEAQPEQPEQHNPIFSRTLRKDERWWSASYKSHSDFACFSVKKWSKSWLV